MTMKIALIVSLLVTSLALNAEMLQGKVVRVADGDTITVLDATNTQNKVRLNKIDILCHTITVRRLLCSVLNAV